MTTSDFDSHLKSIKEQIINQMYDNQELRTKIAGMCYRNEISLDTKIQEDVLQETFLYLWRYDTDRLIKTWCDDPKRVLALAITISVRHGFSKMNNEQSPNQSLAKKILYSSNYKSRDSINSEGSIVSEDYQTEKPLYEQTEDFDVWKLINENLTEDEREFLRFILDNIYSKKRVYYGRELRKKMSYNEYKINLLMLKNRIREIIKINKIKGYGTTNFI